LFAPDGVAKQIVERILPVTFLKKCISVKMASLLMFCCKYINQIILSFHWKKLSSAWQLMA